MLICLKASRGVAQPGSAPEWGSGGRRFESDHPDQKMEPLALMPVDNNIIESGGSQC